MVGLVLLDGQQGAPKIAIAIDPSWILFCFSNQIFWQQYGIRRHNNFGNVSHVNGNASGNVKSGCTDCTKFPYKQ